MFRDYRKIEFTQHEIPLSLNDSYNLAENTEKYKKNSFLKYNENN